MQNIIAKSMRKIIISILLLMMLAILLFIGVIISGKSSVPYIPQHIENALNDLNTGYVFNIEKTVLEWDNDAFRLGMKLVDIDIKNQENNKIINLPYVDISLDFDSLIYGKVKFDEIVIHNPHFSFNTFIDKQDNSKEPNQQASYKLLYSKIITTILDAIKSNNNEVPIRRIRTIDTKIDIKTKGSTSQLVLPIIEINIEKVGKQYATTSFAEGDYLGKKFTFESKGILEDNGDLDVKAKILDLSPLLIAELIPSFSFYSQITHKARAEVAFTVKQNGEMEKIDFAIHAGGSSKQRGVLDISGKIILHENFMGYSVVPEIDAQAVVRDVPMKDLSLYWPPNFAPLPRQWVTSRISNGTYTRAQAKISIGADEIVNRKINHDSVTAIVEFKNGEVNYFDNLPKLYNVNGIAKFDNNNMDLTISNGKISQSDIKNGNIKINKIAENDFRMLINAQFDGKAQDLTKFYGVSSGDNSQERVDFIKNLTGDAKTQFKLEFTLKKSKDFVKNIDVMLLSELSDISIEKLANGMTVDKGQFDVKIYNNEFSLKGVSFLNGVRSEIKYNQYYNKDAKIKKTHSIQMFATGKELAAFGIDDYDAVNGLLDIKYNEVQKGEVISAEIEINADEAEIDLPVIGFKKQQGKALKINLSLDNIQNKNVTTISKLSIKGDDDISIEGAAAISSDKNGFHKIKLDKVKFGDNDLVFNATRNNGNDYKIIFKGESADISPYFRYINDDSRPKEEVAYALDLVMDVKKVNAANDVKVDGLKAIVKCDIELCNSVLIDGKLSDGGEFKIDFDGLNRNINGIAELKIQSDNAGQFLRGIGLLKHVKKGSMEISATHSKESLGLHNGKIIMKYFSVTKAPILGKIFSMASFAGILDLLNGNGISFDKLDGGFKVEDKNIFLSNIKMVGSSIGITANGNIDIKGGKVDVDGSVIPAYTLNSMLGKIPLIGKILVGKEGEGLIATRYSVKGELNDPDVWVNPLSLLTPGFLRRIWGGNDPVEVNDAPATSGDISHILDTKVANDNKEDD